MARRKKKSRRKPALSILKVGAGLAVVDALMDIGGAGEVPLVRPVREGIMSFTNPYIPATGGAQRLVGGLVTAVVLAKGATGLHKMGINPRFMGVTV